MQCNLYKITKQKKESVNFTLFEDNEMFSGETICSEDEFYDRLEGKDTKKEGGHWHIMLFRIFASLKNLQLNYPLFSHFDSSKNAFFNMIFTVSDKSSLELLKESLGELSDFEKSILNEIFIEIFHFANDDTFFYMQQKTYSLKIRKKSLSYTVTIKKYYKNEKLHNPGKLSAFSSVLESKNIMDDRKQINKKYYLHGIEGSKSNLILTQKELYQESLVELYYLPKENLYLQQSSLSENGKKIITAKGYQNQSGQPHKEDGPALLYFSDKGELESSHWCLEGKTVHSQKHTGV